LTASWWSRETIERTFALALQIDGLVELVRGSPHLFVSAGDGSSRAFGVGARRSQRIGTITGLGSRVELAGELVEDGNVVVEDGRVGRSDAASEVDSLHVILKGNDDLEVGRLELRADSGIDGDVVSHLLADRGPLALVGHLAIAEQCESQPLFFPSRVDGDLSTYSSIASKSRHFALELPHVERLVANGRDRDSAAALLSVEEVELLEEVETGAGGSFHRVELL
jgi:hypothetical protein